MEELLRYDSSVQISARTALEDVELHGRKIAKGEEVVTLLGAANHDPEMYDDPDSLDISRTKIRRVPLVVVSTPAWVHSSPGSRLRTQPSA